MDSELIRVFGEYPDLIHITKGSLDNIICSSENYSDSFVNGLVFVYEEYFCKNVVIFVPRGKDSGDQLICSFEIMEKFSESNSIVIFAWSDIYFNELSKINKRRLNTLLKNISKKNKIIILSSCSLKVLDLPILETFQNYQMKLRPSVNYSNFFEHTFLFDLLDQDQEVYESNVDSFIDFVNYFVSECKRVYISLNLSHTKLLSIENRFKELELSVSRKDSSEHEIVINSCKTTEKNFLVHKYDVYIYVPTDTTDLDFYSIFKDSFSAGNVEIYIDSTKMGQVQRCIKNITNENVIPRNVIKDSLEFEKMDELGISDIIMASEGYYRFCSPDSVYKLDLSNLSKKDYDIIREFVKTKLISKFDIEVRTCQLSTPSSPKDRSRKLNSLANKINCFDYRCDCSCEIFKDYSIGVVVWNEIFSNRKRINVLKNTHYVYQTTSGKWKYTSVT